jgi:hypothetical protein
MKPLLSILVSLLLFQAIVLGSLVKIDVQAEGAFDIQKGLVQKTVVLDPFLLPQNAIVFQAMTVKSEWFPFACSFKIISANYLPLPHLRQLPYGMRKKPVDIDIPVFILYGILRL